MHGVTGPIGATGPTIVELSSMDITYNDELITINGGTSTNSWSQLSTSAFPTSDSYVAIATSYNGKYVTTVSSYSNIRRSEDGGITSTIVGPTSLQYYGVCMSYSGQYQAALASGYAPLISSDWGQTWNTFGSVCNWTYNSGLPITMSADGKYIYTTTMDGFIYCSSNFGNTWSNLYTIGMDGNVTAIVVSAAGRYIVYCNAILGLYLSSDFGRTFTRRIVPVANLSPRSVCISSSGQYISATTSTTNVFMISSDYGNTFTNITYSSGSPFLKAICMSASGQYQVACSTSSPSDTNYIYRSSDYGKTWTDYYQNNQSWSSITLSKSGSSVFATVYYGPVYRIYLDRSYRSGIVPEPDNALSLGNSGRRWATVYAANGTIQTSDSALKDSQPLPYGLNEIVQMRTIKYKWKTQADLAEDDPARDFEYYGFCADELAPLFPELVYDENKDAPVQMNYSEILPVMVNAVKDLKQANDALKADNEALKADNEALKGKMAGVLEWLRNTQGVVLP
jgi:hypothetical protein